MAELLERLLAIPKETQTVEFKRLDGSRVVSKIAETIVAMANTDGGQIIIGIDDPEMTRHAGFDRVNGIEENLELYDEVCRVMQRIIPPVSEMSDPYVIDV